MKKVTMILFVFVLAGALSAVSLAQDQPSQPSPSTQQATSGQPTAQPSQDSSTMQTPQASSFNGIIVKASGKYVLNTSDTTYQLDDQRKAKQFEGQKVKINGTLDAGTNAIHVSDISPAS